MLDMDRLRQFARVDGEDEDGLLESLWEAADKYVRDATGKRPPTSNDEVFCQCVALLTAHWYENRTPVTDGSVQDVPFTLQTLLNHISTCSRYPEDSDEPDE